MYWPCFQTPKEESHLAVFLPLFQTSCCLQYCPAFLQGTESLGMRLDLSMELHIHKEASFMLKKIAYVLLSHTHRWAMAEGYGAHLIKHPELIADMVTQASSRSGLPVSIKIRIHNDLRSVGVVKRLCDLGVWSKRHNPQRKDRSGDTSLKSWT